VPNITEFHNLKQQLPKHVQLIAVSKTKPVEDILEIYHEGQLLFGENRVNELVEKASQLPDDIKWHFIGKLQTKKAKKIVPITTLIHSVDSNKLLIEINKQAAKIEKKVSVLLQFHIAKEEAKSGYDYNNFESNNLITLLKELTFIKVEGVMGMATFTDDVEVIEGEFKTLKNIFDQLKSDCFVNDDDFKTISMGMSGDYKLAIHCGSNMVRIGSTIFGSR